MFELNFKDERYLPFEGAGVISKWRLELPQFRQFDYDTISDVVMHVRYISTEGGERLKSASAASATAFMKSIEELGQQEGLFTIIDLQHDLPTEWHKAMQFKDIDGNHKLEIADLQPFLPFYAQRFANSGKFEIADTQFFHSAEITEINLTKTVGLTIKEVKFKSTDTPTQPIQKAYLLIRFTLG